MSRLTVAKQAKADVMPLDGASGWKSPLSAAEADLKVDATANATLTSASISFAILAYPAFHTYI